MTRKDVLIEDKVPEKAVASKKFEYSPLGKKLKAQTGITKNQYQKFDNTNELDETINKKSTLKNYSKSNQTMTLIIVFSNIIMIMEDLRIFLLNESIHF